MSGRSEGDGRRALIGLVTAAVLLMQLAPMATGLLAGLLHGAFHLSSRTGLEHLQAHAEPSFDPSYAPAATSPPVRSAEADSREEHSHGGSTHTHGPDGEAHAHSPTVDRVLRMASSPEQPIMAPTGSSDRGSDRYLRPASADLPTPPWLTAAQPPVRAAALSLLHRTPPVPPPRSSSPLHS